MVALILKIVITRNTICDNLVGFPKSGHIFLVLSSLNKLDTATKGTMRYSNPQAHSSALAVLGMLQPRAFGLLNRLVPLVLASNYYLVIPWNEYGILIITQDLGEVC